jgi:hypothetical protein
MKTKWYVVTITQSVEARNKHDAKETVIDNIQNGWYDGEQIEAEVVDEKDK